MTRSSRGSCGNWCCRWGRKCLARPQWVDTAEKALVELGRNAYDLVLLDYNLPDADGLSCWPRFAACPAAQQPAVIMLTASGNEAIAVEAMKRGAKDYLTKAGLDVPPLMRAHPDRADTEAAGRPGGRLSCPDRGRPGDGAQPPAVAAAGSLSLLSRAPRRRTNPRCVSAIASNQPRSWRVISSGDRLVRHPGRRLHLRCHGPRRALGAGHRDVARPGG